MESFNQSVISDFKEDNFACYTQLFGYRVTIFFTKDHSDLPPCHHPTLAGDYFNWNKRWWEYFGWKRARRTEFRVMICLGNEYIRERGIFQTRWVNQHLKSVDTTVAYLESDNLWKESRLGLEKTVIRQITSQQMPDSTPNQCWEDHRWFIVRKIHSCTVHGDSKPNLRVIQNHA